MMSARGVSAARDYFYNKNAGRSPNTCQALTNYGAGFGLSGLWNAGLNPTQQFVGNFTVTATPDGNGNVSFDLFNRTSVTSFLYGVGPSWDRGPLIDNLGNMDQHYTWTEPIDPSRL